MRPAGGATEIDDAAYLDLTPHPWAGLPVVLRLEAVDGIDQRRPERAAGGSCCRCAPFQHPVARAIIEQRRHLADRPGAARRGRRGARPAEPRAGAVSERHRGLPGAALGDAAPARSSEKETDARRRHGAALGHRAASRGRQPVARRARAARAAGGAARRARRGRQRRGARAPDERAAARAQRVSRRARPARRRSRRSKRPADAADRSRTRCRSSARTCSRCST